MNRNVSPKVVVSVLLAIIVATVAFVVIANFRMDQQSERARLAAEAAQQRQPEDSGLSDREEGEALISRTKGSVEAKRKEA
jgi:hypothetical protein